MHITHDIYTDSDRFSCEISTTLNSWWHPWPIHLESKKNVGILPDKYTATSNNKSIQSHSKVICWFMSMVLEHWREKLRPTVPKYFYTQKSKMLIRTYMIEEYI